MLKSRKNKLQVLVVGLDGLYYWSSNSHIEVVGLVDLYNQIELDTRRDDFEQHLSKYRMFATVTDALKHIRPDFAAVIVPNNRKNTINAELEIIHHGIDLVVQKLRLDSMQGVDQLVDAAKVAKSKIIIGEQYRYLNTIQAIKALLDNGEIGKVDYVKWDCYLPCDSYAWMKSYRHLALEDLAYHHFGALHYLLGLHPTHVYAQSFEPGYATAETNTIGALLADTLEDYRFIYSLVWSSRVKSTSYLGDIVIEGTNGSIILSGDQLSYTSSEGNKREIVLKEANYEGSWSVFDHFCDTTISGESLPGPFTLEQFEPVLRTIYHAVASAESREMKWLFG